MGAVSKFRSSIPVGSVKNPKNKEEHYTLSWDVLQTEVSKENEKGQYELYTYPLKRDMERAEDVPVIEDDGNYIIVKEKDRYGRYKVVKKKPIPFKDAHIFVPNAAKKERIEECFRAKYQTRANESR